MTVDAAYYERLMRSAHEGVKFIVPLEVLAGAQQILDVLTEWGAAPPFVIAGTRGTGEVPDLDPERSVLLGTSGPTIMHSIRAFYAAIHDLPDEVVDAIDRWDPDHEAVVLGMWLDVDLPVAGRPQYGGRPIEWAALEDKTTVDALWDDIGIDRAPSAIVAVADAPAAAVRLDAGMGTVWTADNREGWHGGAEYLRWVRDAADVEAAAAFFAETAHRVRVMPFLDGIPCSIHGMAFEAGEVIAFRPNEMLMFRVPGASQLRYASVSNFWEPRPADATYMRDVARRTAAHLHAELGYRGVVTIDGVMTGDGFLPTELNPRMGIGLGPASRAAGVPMGAIHRSVTNGDPFDFRPHELERFVMDGSERARRCRAMTIVELPEDGHREADVAFGSDGAASFAATSDEAHGSMQMGPAAAGRFVGVGIADDGAPIGPSIAPRVAAAFALADREWGAGIGPLEPAPDLRPSS